MLKNNRRLETIEVSKTKVGTIEVLETKVRTNEVLETKKNEMLQNNIRLPSF